MISTSLRRNGFSKPLDSFQIASWILFVLFVAEFYVFGGRLLPAPWDVITMSVFGAISLVVVISNYICAVTDPADPGVKAATYGRLGYNAASARRRLQQQRLEKELEKSKRKAAAAAAENGNANATDGCTRNPTISDDSSSVATSSDRTVTSGAGTSKITPLPPPLMGLDALDSRLAARSRAEATPAPPSAAALAPPVVHPPGHPRTPMEDLLFCYICQAHVRRGAKHCRSCNKCTVAFDHHCRWLSNCVSKTENYKSFLVFVVATLLCAVGHLAVSVVQVVLYFGEGRRIDDGGTHYPNGLLLAFWFAFIVLALVAIYLLVDLLLFHIYLIAKGITTYDYIVAQRQRKDSVGRDTGGGGSRSSISSSSGGGGGGGGTHRTAGSAGPSPSVERSGGFGRTGVAAGTTLGDLSARSLGEDTEVVESTTPVATVPSPGRSHVQRHPHVLAPLHHFEGEGFLPSCDGPAAGAPTQETTRALEMRSMSQRRNVVVTGAFGHAMPGSAAASAEELRMDVDGAPAESLEGRGVAVSAAAPSAPARASDSRSAV